jgi:hypothetical protein
MPYADPAKQREWKARNLGRRREQQRKQRERQRLALTEKRAFTCHVPPDVYERLEVEVAVRGGEVGALVERLLNVIVDDEMFDAVLDGE